MALAYGFEQMKEGTSQLSQYYTADRPTATSTHFERMRELGATQPQEDSLFTPFTQDILKMFAHAQELHMQRYGSQEEQYDLIAFKNHQHGSRNPKAMDRRAIPMDKIRAAPRMEGPIKRYQACAIGNGAAAALLVTESWLRKHPELRAQAVEIVAQSLVGSHTAAGFEGDFIDLAGVAEARLAAQDLWRQAPNVSPSDVVVAEVHDCFSANELFQMEALGFCGEGKGGDFVADGEWRDGFYFSGRQVCVNPSGGLESKSHPIGATGLMQCYEIVHQLRGDAGERQVPGAAGGKFGLQHNYGINGGAVLSLYKGPHSGNSRL